jgi:cytochrome b561
MNALNTATRWGLVSQAFHWLMFLLILGAWFAVESHEDFPKGSDERAAWMTLHKALGVSVFFLVWLRIGARFAQVTPAAVGSAMQQKVAALTAFGLYALMIFMPATGLLASQLFGRAVDWFGVLQIPVFMAENKELGKAVMEAHENAFGALLALLALHVGGALYHHFVVKDDVLKRMLPWGK